MKKASELKKERLREEKQTFVMRELVKTKLKVLARFLLYVEYVQNGSGDDLTISYLKDLRN